MVSVKRVKACKPLFILMPFELIHSEVAIIRSPPHHHPNPGNLTVNGQSAFKDVVFSLAADDTDVVLLLLQFA